MLIRVLAVVVAVLVAFALGLAISPLARWLPQVSAQPGAERGISVVGEGRITTSPDLARATFGVEIVDPSLNKALADAASQMERVVSRLVQLGVNRDDIRTVRFSVAPVYDNRPPVPGGTPTSILRGYRVSNAVSVTIRGIDRVGVLIDEAVASGATRIEGIAFDTSQLSQFKDQARELAMANARAKAEQLASLAGVGLGRPLLIEESDPTGVPVARPAMAAQAAAPETTPIEGGQLEIRTTVRVVWSTS
jgi:uncharacterized protein YggE